MEISICQRHAQKLNAQTEEHEARKNVGPAQVWPWFLHGSSLSRLFIVIVLDQDACYQTALACPRSPVPGKRRNRSGIGAL